MITIKFDNYTLYLTSIYMQDFFNNPKYLETLSQYSFDDNFDFENLVLNTHLTIYYHQPINPDTFNPILNNEDFETILKCLEQLYLYQRKFPLLQMDFYPTDPNNIHAYIHPVTIYTYSQIWEEDFDKFQEAPNKEYTWDNIPKSLNNPNSNMQVQDYNPLTHIATVYHYYTL